MRIVYEAGEEGWIVASIPEVPGVHSQGKTREEARGNVIDAVRGMLELRFGDHPSGGTAADSEPLELVRWGAVARIVVGSTAETLLRQAPCSLLLVPRPAEEPAAAEDGIDADVAAAS
jgi:predicted RNase H-like HicB family nuclease